MKERSQVSVKISANAIADSFVSICQGPLIDDSSTVER